jgi:signal transduction histidine kinase
VEAHGGKIWAENNNNNNIGVEGAGGATFTFILPIRKQQEQLRPLGAENSINTQ